MDAKIITEFIKNELDIGQSSNLIIDHKKIAKSKFNGTKNIKNAEIP